MGRHIFKNRLFYPLFICLVVLAAAFVHTGKAEAAPGTGVCESERVGALGSSYGNGYQYQVIRFHLRDSDLNHSDGSFTTVNCTLTRASGQVGSIFTANGMEADKIWFGPNIPGEFDGNSGAASVTPVPNYGGASDNTDGEYTIFQDDAAAFRFNGDRLHCVGFVASEESSCGDGSNVYDQGWTGWDGGSQNVNDSDSIAGNRYRGAGFYSSGSRDLTPNVSKTNGLFNDTPIQAKIKNTWTGNFRATVIFTVRYKQIPYASLDGVKIDDSKVSAVGDTSTTWGGTCHSASNPAACNSGSLANYPFSDDYICVAGYSCDKNNSYNITSIIPGTYTIYLDSRFDTPNGIWNFRGYSMCEDGGGCTTQYLTSLANIDTTTGTSFTHYFAPGKTYHMRWIFTRPPPPTNSCTARVLVAGNPESEVELGQSFNLESTFTLSGGPVGVTYAYTATVNGISLYTGPQPFATGSVGTDSSTTISTASITASPAGSYSGNIQITFNNEAPTLTCPVSVTVGTKPYTKLYNGDISVGANFEDASGNCSVTSPSISNISILGFTRTDHAGAGTTLAAFALNNIQDYSTAAARSGPTPADPPAGLAFANTAAPAGNLDSAFFYDQCAKDWFANPPAGTTVITPAVGTKHTVNGFTAAANSQTNIYVDGDVFIANDILYAGTGGFGANPNQIPAVRVVAKGNIYISQNVHSLSGIFVAQPRNASSGGTIYTCAMSTASPLPTKQDLNGDCKTQLSIFGAVIAKQIKLQRTKGTLKDATTTENYTTANQAETFIFSPDLWIPNYGTSNDVRVDGITALPPLP